MVLTCGCEVTTTDPARITRACEQHGRVSLRDHFAGQAMQFVGDHDYDPFTRGFVDKSADQLAQRCYELADAMLRAREEGL